MAVKDGLPATDFSRQNREWVKAVAGGGSGGGGGLPEITPADEGKVLTVESGAAAWATAGGGGGGGGGDIFWITVSHITENDEVIGVITDKTAGEIDAAISSHKLLAAIYDQSDEEATDYTFRTVESYAHIPAENIYMMHVFDWGFSAESSSDYMTYIYD